VLREERCGRMTCMCGEAPQRYSKSWGKPRAYCKRKTSTSTSISTSTLASTSHLTSSISQRIPRRHSSNRRESNGHGACCAVELPLMIRVMRITWRRLDNSGASQGKLRHMKGYGCISGDPQIRDYQRSNIHRSNCRRIRFIFTNDSSVRQKIDLRAD
jgi:hypothetical protein